ncbi:hypothetical protein LUU34_00417200 [Aix galericulata]|nr:hypothetical protein LUU34_00417200 [Aix galericulata]
MCLPLASPRRVFWLRKGGNVAGFTEARPASPRGPCWSPGAAASAPSARCVLGTAKRSGRGGVLARMLGLGHPNKSSPPPPGSVASCFITSCPCWVQGEELAGGCRGAGHLGCAPSPPRLAQGQRVHQK